MDVFMTGCSFIENGESSDSLLGAAIYMKSSMNLQITRVQFIENRAYIGGAVYVESMNNVFFDRIHISSNRAEYTAALYLKSNADVRGGRFFFSKAPGVNWFNREDESFDGDSKMYTSVQLKRR
jgi:predicted outer membrane repeat protein